MGPTDRSENAYRNVSLQLSICLCWQQGFMVEWTALLLRLRIIASAAIRAAATTPDAMALRSACCTPLELEDRRGSEPLGLCQGVELWLTPSLETSEYVCVLCQFVLCFVKIYDVIDYCEDITICTFRR